jgi:hypothetical protein
MAQLVVLGVDHRADVERRFDLVGDLANQEQLQIQDAAYAYRDEKRKVRIHQAIGLTGQGAASGAVWGTLIGLSFLNRGPDWPSGRPAAPKPGSSPTSVSPTPSGRSRASRGAGRQCLLARSAAVDKVIAADNRSTPRPWRRPWLSSPEVCWPELAAVVTQSVLGQR